MSAHEIAPAPAPAPITDAIPEPVSKPIADVRPTPAPKPSAATGRRPPSAAKRWFLGLSMEQRNNVTSLCQEREAQSCARVLALKMPRPVRAPAPVDPVSDDGEPQADPVVPAKPEDLEEKYLAGMSSRQRQQASAYCQERSTMVAPHCETPLVVAFDNQPVEFLPAGRERFAFTPGEPVATDWPTAETPWIALDLDGDGEITSGAELFGSSTVLGGGTTARDGFEALAALDANRDGTLDARDPMFARLVLWSDRNDDRRGTSDEQRPLASVIAAIPLAHTVDARCNARDDCEGERGTLRWRDVTGAKHEGAVVDIYVPRR